MRRRLPLLALLLLGLAAPARARAEEAAPPPPPVDLVLCLDTSGSMDGLLDAARQKLWKVVSELATATPTPDLRVALLTYGTPVGTDGDVVVRTDLTGDLDLVSERLFALVTNGGDELVGRVVARSIDALAWRSGTRILFVAGNESADQDRERPFRDEARRAAARGIRVNAIYCGGADDGDAAGYRELASLGGGRYASIDQNHGTVTVATPFDADLSALSVSLNGTYVPYGEGAAVGLERQRAQDANAAAASPSAAAERAEAKAGGLYRNAGWDLVDRMEEDGFDLASVPEADLPEALRALAATERLAWLEAKRAERQDLQARIRDLTEQRAAHVRRVTEEQQLDDGRALDRALRDAVREQAPGLSFPAAR
jgi:hypothetical protein